MLPKSFQLPLGYNWTRATLINHKMNVGLTVRVPFEHAQVTQTAVSMIARAFQEQRQLDTKRAAQFTELVVYIQPVEVDGAGATTRIGQPFIFRANMRRHGQSSHPDTGRPVPFDQSAFTPEVSAASKTGRATPTRNRRVYMKRRRYIGYIDGALARIIDINAMYLREDDGIFTPSGPVD